MIFKNWSSQIISLLISQHLNKPNSVCGKGKHFCVSDLIDASSTTPSKLDLIKSKPDYQFVLPFNNYAVAEPQIYSREFYHHFLSVSTAFPSSFRIEILIYFLLSIQILALDGRPSSELSKT